MRERLRQESEERELSLLTICLDQDQVFKNIWNNKKDSAYDKI